MSEFVLVRKDDENIPSEQEITSVPLTGEASLSVLGLGLGSNDWSQKLSEEEIPGWKALRSSAFGELSYGPQTGELQWRGKTILRCHSSESKEVECGDLPGMLIREGDKLPEGQKTLLEWTWQLQPQSNLYGCGQRSGPLERTGLTATNWTTDSPLGHNRTTDPLYQAHPLLWGVTGDCWWAILLCHTAYSRFDLGQEKPGYLKISTLGTDIWMQVHAQETPEELYRSLGQVFKTPSLPPLWSLGFHQSRWGYKSAAEVTQLIETFREKSIPLDVVHLDIDHMDDYRSFTFHSERFPKAPQLLKEWKDKHQVHAVTIIDPGLKFDTSTGYGPLQRGLAGDHFIKSPSNSPQVGFCWPDEALFPDFTRSATRHWWAEECQFYLDNGIDGLWIDMNEPAIFDKPFWSGESVAEPMPLNTPWGEDEKRLDHARLRNVYGSFMSQATKAAWKKRQRRPWVLTRAAFTGAGSEAWSWMGDNTSWWEHLALSFPQLSSMGLVHSGLVGVDVGGFFGHCDAALYSAWIEASVVYPFLRAHSALGTDEQHPWSFGPEVEEVARTALDLRYQLLPYLYTAVEHHCRGGVPPLRPMFFDYPNDSRFRYLQNQVMFGSSMMACPFLERGQWERLVQLPEGEWYCFHSGKKVNGESFVVKRRPGLIPLFVKAGSVIPTFASGLQCSRQAETADFVWRHFPGDSSVHSEFYWDSGEGWDFQEGQCLRMTLTGSAEEVFVQSSKVHADFAQRRVVLQRASSAGWETVSGRPLAQWTES